MRGAAHSTAEGGSSFFVPGVGVPAAYANAGRSKSLDQWQRAFYFRRKRRSLNDVGVCEQLISQFRRWFTDEFRILRAHVAGRDERHFHLRASDQRALSTVLSHPGEKGNDPFDLRCCRGQQKGGRAPAPV